MLFCLRSGFVPSRCLAERCNNDAVASVIDLKTGDCFSLGGDCDTLTCIAGSIAEAFYGVPEEMQAECRNRLSEDMIEVLDRFENWALEKYEEGQDLMHHVMER